MSKLIFREIKPKLQVGELEEEILKFWKDNNLIDKINDPSLHQNKPIFSFIEGPPTANGLPGIHHIEARTYKDLTCRYYTMLGYFVPRIAGWDTHGLPVELEVEKKLNIKGKKEIEKVGIEKFNSLCKRSVFEYKAEWEKLTNRIGFWLDMTNPYITYSNDYIESVWWSLKEIWKKGLLKRDYKIVPYCSRCGTALSSHEVALGYKSIEELSIYVKLRLSDSEQETYFLVWTTTPWTLISNVAIAVNPQIEYVLVEHGSERYILAKERMNMLKEDTKIIKEFKGEQLEGTRYNPLFTYSHIDNTNAFKVICAEFVTIAEGTGMVHIAPAFGEDDFNVGKKYQLPIVKPIDESGKFTEEIPPLNGVFFKNADDWVIEELKKKDMLYFTEMHSHDYPYCWRCSSPLMYYAKETWLILMSKLKNELLANNEKINWYPSHIKHGRFGNWLENVKDWALSRQRFWGTPLPIWVCDNCNTEYLIGSLEELKSLSVQKLTEEIDLHKPFIDEIKLKCLSCGGSMKRVPDVIDCWYDSGSAPFAQFHYPFENKSLFEQRYPYDFICEAQDQTRGWFYTLLAISTILFNEPAYKNVLVAGLILDEKGEKMSKSKGNAVDPWSVIHKFGADATRYYMCAFPAWSDKRFGMGVLDEKVRPLFNTLWNIYYFFINYSNLDKFDPSISNISYNDREKIDQWLISRYNTLVLNVRASMRDFLVNNVCDLIQTFVIDELSNWYIRISRENFWVDKAGNSKLSAYCTLYEVLYGLIRLMAPLTPFITEEIYQNIVRNINKNAPISIHLTEYPINDDTLINKELEKEMEETIKIVKSAREGRNLVGINIRQPLSELIIITSLENEKRLANFEYIIKHEINIKKIVYKSEDEKEDYLRYKISPNQAVLGPKYKSLVITIINRLQSIDPIKVKNSIQSEGKYTLTINDVNIDLKEEDIKIEKEPIDEFAMIEGTDFTIFLNTVLTPALKREGIIRDFIRRIQIMRKEMNLDYSDEINIWISTEDPFIKESIIEFNDYIKNETLSEIVKIDSIPKKSYIKEWEIKGLNVEIGILKHVMNKGG
ncbi:MAG: isoleucine--tRNA ligase [Candidatus Methanoperedens sp.]